MQPGTAPSRVVFTLAGTIEGARMSLAMLPGVLVFAAAVGAASAEKGLTLGQAVLMSASVYAGASQLLALQLWPQHFTPAAIAAMVVVTMAVNLRFVLMGAALQPWLARAPRGPAWLGLATLTDSNFIIASRHQAGGGNDVGVFVGAGVFLWIVWTLATVPGHLVGHMLTDPRRFAIDMVMPIVFTAMAVGVFRLKRDRLAWPVAAAVALATAQLVEGYWFIVSGALAGSIAAGLMRERG
jgi:predicted branched-subunit amino acid permease